MAISTRECLSIRASEILGQQELVDLLKLRFPESAKRVGGLMPEGMETIEVRVPLNSPKLEEIRDLIMTRRQQGIHEFTAFTIGHYLRKYTVAELRNAEVLLLSIAPHFEPAGEECGTIYETLCPYCNLGRQVSDLILDLRRVPQHKDIVETIARVEWVVSSRFVQGITENRLSGAEFRPIFRVQEPHKTLSAMASASGCRKSGGDRRPDLDWQRPFQPIGSQLALPFRAFRGGSNSL